MFMERVGDVRTRPRRASYQYVNDRLLRSSSLLEDNEEDACASDQRSTNDGEDHGAVAAGSGHNNGSIADLNALESSVILSAANSAVSVDGYGILGVVEVVALRSDSLLEGVGTLLQTCEGSLAAVLGLSGKGTSAIGQGEGSAVELGVVVGSVDLVDIYIEGVNVNGVTFRGAGIIVLVGVFQTVLVVVRNSVSVSGFVR